MAVALSHGRDRAHRRHRAAVRLDRGARPAAARLLEKHPGETARRPRAALDRGELRCSSCPSGLLMFTAHATEFIESEVFVLKMLLIMAAGVNAALFHTTMFRSADVWDSEEMRKLPPPPSVRASAASVAGDLDLGNRLRATTGLLLKTDPLLARRGRPGCRRRSSSLRPGELGGAERGLQRAAHLARREGGEPVERRVARLLGEAAAPVVRVADVAGRSRARWRARRRRRARRSRKPSGGRAAARGCAPGRWRWRATPRRRRRSAARRTRR